MEQKFYKREGRRFVQVDIPIICDNTGKYYQKDGSFVNERTEDSIGLCIMSTTKEHVVMSLVTFYSGKFDYINIKLKNEFNGKGELPKLHELMIALILLRKKLNIAYFEDIWAIHPITSVARAAYAGYGGSARVDPASDAHYVAGLRSIIRIPQIYKVGK